MNAKRIRIFHNVIMQPMKLYNLRKLHVPQAWRMTKEKEVEKTITIGGNNSKKSYKMFCLLHTTNDENPKGTIESHSIIFQINTTKLDYELVSENS